MREPREGDVMPCPECGQKWEVSVEDPDSSFGDLLRHVRTRHPAVDQTPAVLWPRINVVSVSL
jgi:hypothetical protein